MADAAADDVPEWRRVVRTDSGRNLNRQPAAAAADQQQQQTSPASDYCMKFVLLGDSGVGKTSLWRCYTKGIKLLDIEDERERREHKATIGVQFLCRDVLIGQYRVKVMIWDTAGQERFEAISLSYIRGAHGLILVYDVTRPETCQHALEWYAKARDKFESDVLHPLVLVVGNKIDLVAERRVARGEASELFQRLNFFYQEISCQTAENIQDALDYFAGACWVQCIRTVTAAATATAEKKSVVSSMPLGSRPIESLVDPQRPLHEQVTRANIDATDPRVLKLLGAAQYGTARRDGSTALLPKGSRRQAIDTLGLRVIGSSGNVDHTDSGENFDSPVGCGC